MTLSLKVRWYLRRLQVMSPGELVHRVGEQLHLQRLRLAATLSPGWPAVPGGGAGATPVVADGASFLPTLTWHFDPESDEARGLLDGQVPALGFAWRYRGVPECWHEAPDTGRAWPRAFFGAIDYRAGNPYGDIRVAWEPARLQWLVGLGLICRHGTPAQAVRAAGCLEAGLVSFMEANPPLKGIHYVSSMECALRVIAVCHALDLARDHLSHPTRTWARAIQLVGQHAQFIEGRLSLHSSAGNHTIAEAAGLIYAGLLFPGLPGADRWAARGLGLLRQEAPRQILADGGGVEQAFGYLQFIADLCGLVLALLAHRGMEAPPEIAAAYARARAFLGTMAGALGAIPRIGDGDGGHALAPWLRLSLPDVSPASKGDITFPAAGYSILGGTAGASSVVLLDHGPLGMPPSYGHGHADALAIVLRYRGQEVLMDPGTYTYTGDVRWRRHFRSTPAHNTVTVDGEDQAVQVSSFMWSEPYAAELVRLERQGDVVRALARHQGYSRCGGVVHWRGVTVRDSGAVLVWDRLTGAGPHQADLHWHLGMPVIPMDGGWLIGNALNLDVQGAKTVTLQSGDNNSTAGWSSPLYGRLEPIHVLRARHDGLLPCEFLTRIWPRATAAPLHPWRDDLEILRRWLD